jgi:hypothetical protein
MPYVDPNTVHNPATGTVAPAAWGDVIRDDLEFMIDPPICSVFHSTTQNVTTGGSGVDLAADSENFDNDAMHSTVTNNSRITIQTAGRYLLTATIDFQQDATGQRQLQFKLNDTTTFGIDRRQTTSSLVAINQSTATIALVAGDYVEVNAFQNSGSTLTCNLRMFTVLYLTR